MALLHIQYIISEQQYQNAIRCKSYMQIDHEQIQHSNERLYHIKKKLNVLYVTVYTKRY